MQVIKTMIDGLLIIEPDIHGDARGYFYESYTQKKYSSYGIDTLFLQDNQSYTKSCGTIRGLHFQSPPHAQTKLVRCTRGKILDVAVDIRANSPTFKKWISVELSEENKRQLYIPKGFAHGFVTLCNDCDLQYKVDDYYSPECDRTIAYNDPDFNVQWGVDVPVLSAKDMTALSFVQQEIVF
jgi:dTDP-4-dehydrorhamnose 3,5-epimerase